MKEAAIVLGRCPSRHRYDRVRAVCSVLSAVSRPGLLRAARRWRISGDQICFSYAEGQRDLKWDCTKVKLKGNQIIWNDDTTAELSEGAR
jgi:hypothetical protein